MEKLDFKILNSCPLCHRDESEIFFKDKEITVHRCECGLKYLNPCLMPEAMNNLYESSDSLKNINKSLENYYERASLDKDSRTLKDYNRVLDLLEEKTQGRRLLDVGFGSGMFLAEAKNRGWRVEGVDSSKKNVERAKELFDLSLDKGIFPADVSKNKKYDAITLWDVIEHTDRPNETMKCIFELLAPGGIVVLATPNVDNLLTFIARLISSISGGLIKFPMRKFFVIEHTLYFNAATLKNLCNSNGFDVLALLQTETDITRYKFNYLEKLILRSLFMVARILKMRNRIVCFAQKRGSAE